MTTILDTIALKQIERTIGYTLTSDERDMARANEGRVVVQDYQGNFHSLVIPTLFLEELFTDRGSDDDFGF